MDALSSYVPVDRRYALAQQRTLPERATGAVLLADLAGFTPATETIARAFGPYRGAEELLSILNRIYEALMAECDHYGGSVVCFAGDAITVWFDGDAGDSVQAGRRAIACAQAMQSAMESFRTLSVPGGQTLTLALRTVVTTGPVRRLLVGDPSQYVLEVLAGATMVRLVRAAHLAKPGQVVLDAATSSLLSEHLGAVDYYSEGEERITIVRELASPVKPQPWVPLPPGTLSDDQVCLWLLPPVYARLHGGQGAFLAELRHTVSLFLRFSDLDYDGDDEAGAKLDAFVRWVQQVLSSCEGWLLHVTIGDKGSYLYATFGAPVAHGDDAARAVAAALQLREPPAELSFINSVQIGINGGQTRTGAVGGSTRFYSADGDSVNLAARLMQEAAAGQVLMSAKLAPSVSRSYLLEPLAARQLRGRAEPVPVVAITGPQTSRAIHLQEPQYALPLVGRTGEVALVEAKLAQAQRGEGQIIGITGEAGIGKSRLVAAAIQRASAAGFVGFGGAAQSTGTQTAYLAWQPVWRAFFDLNGRTSAAEQAAALERQLTALDPALLPRLPLLGDVLGLRLAENDLTRSLEAKLRKETLERLLVDCLQARYASRSSSPAPLLLVLEDVHWLDALSLDLLFAIGRAIATLPVLLVLAYRPPETERGPQFPFASLPHATEIRLGELTRDEAAQLIERKVALTPGAPVTLPAPFVEAITARTEGNPFYIEELLNYLHERGVAPGDMAAFERVELPGSLASLILSRIDQLSAAQQTTLKVASVVGRVFRFAWLWSIYYDLGLQEQVRQDLDLLAALNITPLDTPEPDLSYLFNHITTQQVIYESVSFALRERLHEQLAAWLERQPEGSVSLDLLAYHYGRSTNTAKQLEYFKKAGDAAATRYANTAAIQYYERLLPLLPREEHAPVLLDIGRIHSNTSSWEDAEARCREALAMAEELDNTRLKARAKVGLSNTFWSRARYDESLTWLEQARSEFEMMNDQEESSETLRQMSRILFYQGNMDRARALAEQSLALKGENGDKSRLANTYGVLGGIAVATHDSTKGREWLSKSLALRRELGDRAGLAAPGLNLAMIAFMAGNLDEARDLAQESAAIYQELGSRWEYSVARLVLGLVLATQGDAVRACQIQIETLTFFRDTGAIQALDGGLIGVAHATQLAEQTPEAHQFAIKLIAAGTKINDTTRTIRLPVYHAIANDILARARQALDQASADRAWTEGYTMDRSEALAYALAYGQS